MQSDKICRLRCSITTEYNLMNIDSLGYIYFSHSSSLVRSSDFDKMTGDYFMLEPHIYHHIVNKSYTEALALKY